jgi:L-ascorbate metabolism protein UlaG (beta-lactamase superfamily)
MNSVKADIALLPVSGTYVMTADEAAKAVNIIKPKIAIPMHYGSGVAGTVKDAERFKQACKETKETEVRILKVQ